MHFLPVTAKNKKEVLSLKVNKEQINFIETVEDCIKEAEEIPYWRTIAIYDNETIIGFAMYGFFPHELPSGRLWLDRILIDKKYQKKGYGKKAVSLLIKRLKEEYPPQKIYLSVVEQNKVAIKLYYSFGFQFTGELDTKGEKIMCLLPV